MKGEVATDATHLRLSNNACLAVVIDEKAARDLLKLPYLGDT